MCGIVGGYGNKVEIGMSSLFHRGPDANGLLKIGDITFGHTRLSIIDLDPRSNQPFQYNNLTLVFNGEIWNYKEIRKELIEKGLFFSTEGDTEVLAAALDYWDIRALNKLQGMFAIAWTKDGENLYISRDRFGETPLHIAKQSPFYFASEKKALLAMGCHPEAIIDVDPGTYLKINQKSMQVFTYYDLPIKHSQDNLLEASKNIYSLIGEGCQERTISDVPVCTLLSGGIDSTCIAYWLKKSFPNLVAYTAVFNKNSTDLRAARMAAKMIGIELREVKIPLPSPDDLDEIIRIIEMDYKAQIEIGWPCLILAKQIHTDGFKVTYSGEGADELWASYGFSYYALKTKDWHQYRKELFLTQAKKNFMRCNKIFMAHSIECCLPFLNTHLVEYAISLKENSVRNGTGKPKLIMQKAFSGKIPDYITNRPKVAFQDGLGIKQAIKEKVLVNPLKYYRSEYEKQYR